MEKCPSVGITVPKWVLDVLVMGWLILCCCCVHSRLFSETPQFLASLNSEDTHFRRLRPLHTFWGVILSDIIYILSQTNIRKYLTEAKLDMKI